MKISVIIPIFNGEMYIKNCIESIQNQTHSDIEILAVNNGSSDNSEKILRDLSLDDNRIKIFTLTENKGPATARNLGLKNAVGDYIAFCDCDDFVPADAYEKALMKKDVYLSDKAYKKEIEKKKKQSCTENSEVELEEGKVEMFFLEENISLTEEDDEIAKRLKIDRYVLADVIVGNFTRIENDKKHYENVSQRAKSPFSICDMECLWNKLYRREFLENHQLMIPDVPYEKDLLFLSYILQCSPRYSVSWTNMYCYVVDDDDRRNLQTKQSGKRVIETTLQGRRQYIEIINDLGYQTAGDLSFYSFRYVFKKWLDVYEEIEKEQSFTIIQKFVEDMDWKGTSNRFYNLVGVTPDEFSQCTLRDFLFSYDHHTFKISSREEVNRNLIKQRNKKISNLSAIQQFEQGEQGLKTLIQCGQGWLAYKIKKCR